MNDHEVDAIVDDDDVRSLLARAVVFAREHGATIVGVVPNCAIEFPRSADPEALAEFQHRTRPRSAFSRRVAAR